MKTFKNGKGVSEYLQKVLEKSKQEFIETTSEQLYKDSEKYTYEDTHEMYKTGAINSQFDKGLIIERTPYVRRRYYEGGTPGAENPNAKPYWFEETFKEYKSDYERQYKKIVDKAKKEV